MNEFPRMLYKAGGPEEIHGGHFHTLIVDSQDDQDAALADGWHLTTPKAIEADKASRVNGSVGTAGSGTPAADDAPPTRDEMKAKAAELGLTFKHNISNAALADMIKQAFPKD